MNFYNGTFNVNENNIVIFMRDNGDFSLKNFLWFLHSWADYKLQARALPCYNPDGSGTLSGFEFDQYPFNYKGIRYIGLGMFQDQWLKNPQFINAYKELVEEHILEENPDHKFHFQLLQRYYKVGYWRNINWNNDIETTLNCIKNNFTNEALAVPYQLRKEYNDYLKSPEWREKCKQVLNRDEFKCTMCGSTEDLKVHHKSYEHLKHEPLDDLTTLCDHCHRHIHGLD